MPRNHRWAVLLTVLVASAMSVAAQAQAQLVEQMPAAGTPKPFGFPKAATRTLPNGMRVFVVSNSEQPVVSVRLVVMSAGAANDPAGRPGVAAMTADLLTQGTTTRTAQQIAEAIDFVGGSLTAGTDSDAAYVSLTVVKKDLATGMTLLADVVLNPVFQQEELERRRQQSLSNMEVNYSDADYLGNVILDRVVFGEHPYALPSEGTPDSVQAFTREQMAAFHRAQYAPNTTLMAFAGDITPQAAFAAAEKYFGGWAQKQPPAIDAAAPASPSGRRIYLVDKPDAVQTQIRVGRLGIARNNPDYIPLLVTNRIFGGGFNSRLSTEVRQKKGLTYGAYSGFDSMKQAGSFVASTSTRTEATIEATKLVTNLIAEMQSGATTKEELDFARDYLAGVFPIQSETPGQVAGRVLTVAQFDLPADYNSAYPQRVLAVGPDDVKRMGARYFDASALDIVLVGNAAAFREALLKEFPGVKLEELRFDQVDLLKPDLKRAAPTPKPAS